ncbi:MAG: DUF6159 family protein [Nitriliruptoraceae bacterium]
MEKLRNTLSLARSSWSVLQADKELLLLPLLSGIASAIVAASLLVPLVLTGGADQEPTTLGYVLLFVMYVVLAYVTIFFNAALVAGAHERLHGGDPTVASALRAAASHAGRILPWAIVSATVSVVLQVVQQRGGLAGRGVAGIAGLAWSLITFLVIPVIVIEGLGVGDAVKRSSALFKQTWGENVAARVGFGLLGFLLALPAVLLVVVGFAAGTVGGGIAIAVAVVWLLAVTLVMASLNSIFQTALYLYAAEREVPSGYFEPRQFRQAFDARGATPA